MTTPETPEALAAEHDLAIIRTRVDKGYDGWERADEVIPDLRDVLGYYDRVLAERDALAAELADAKGEAREANAHAERVEMLTQVAVKLAETHAAELASVRGERDALAKLLELMVVRTKCRNGDRADCQCVRCRARRRLDARHPVAAPPPVPDATAVPAGPGGKP